MTSEHKNDCVHSVVSLRSKPMNERLRNLGETARERRKVNGGH